MNSRSLSLLVVVLVVGVVVGIIVVGSHAVATVWRSWWSWCIWTLFWMSDLHVQQERNVDVGHSKGVPRFVMFEEMKFFEVGLVKTDTVSNFVDI